MAIDPVTGLNENGVQVSLPFHYHNFKGSIFYPPSLSQSPDLIQRDANGKITFLPNDKGTIQIDGIIYDSTFDYDKQSFVNTVIGIDPYNYKPPVKQIDSVEPVKTVDSVESVKTVEPVKTVDSVELVKPFVIPVQTFSTSTDVTPIYNSQPIFTYLGQDITVISNYHIDSIRTLEKRELLNVQDDPDALFYRGNIQARSLRAATTKVFADKNSDRKGDQSLNVGEAVFFKFGSKTYLTVNDDRSKFNAASDVVLNVTGLNLSDRNVGKLKVTSYF